jgi:hypothetical protein
MCGTEIIVAVKSSIMSKMLPKLIAGITLVHEFPSAKYTSLIWHLCSLCSESNVLSLTIIGNLA